MRTILLLLCLCIVTASATGAKERPKYGDTTTSSPAKSTTEPEERPKYGDTTTSSPAKSTTEPEERPKYGDTTTSSPAKSTTEPEERPKYGDTTTSSPAKSTTEPEAEKPKDDEAITPSPAKSTTEPKAEKPKDGEAITPSPAKSTTEPKGPKCSMEDAKRCAGHCVLVNWMAVCKCKPNQREVGFNCTDECSSRVLLDCVLGRCIIENNSERCTCFLPFENDGPHRCTLKHSFYTIKFKVVRRPRWKRSAEMCPDADKVTEWVEQLYPDAKNVTILECRNGEYNIHLEFKAEATASELRERIRGCKEVEGTPNLCILPGNLTVAKDTIKLSDENLCDSVLKDYIRELNQNHVCQKEGDEYVLKCPDKFRSMGANEVSLSRNVWLTVHYCSEEPCNNITCPEHNRACVEGKCVCKKGFVQQGDDCIDACSTNPCKNGGTCKQHPDVNFLCLCPAKFKGLLCEGENLELRGAKLNVVIVGVVLAVLLLLALIVSASVISRMKKKQGIIDDSSKELGIQSRHAYEGPYNASAPVYNSDNTML